MAETYSGTFCPRHGNLKLSLACLARFLSLVVFLATQFFVVVVGCIIVVKVLSGL